MKATGIIHRIDYMSRIVIPKEVRRALRIKEGQPFEVSYDEKTGAIMFTPYDLSAHGGEKSSTQHN